MTPEPPTRRNSPDLHAQLLTLPQAARFLGVSRATIYRMIQSGLLPVTPIKIGAESRLARRQLERWLDGRDPMTGAVPEPSSSFSEFGPRPAMARRGRPARPSASW